MAHQVDKKYIQKGDNVNRALKERIKEKSKNICQICYKHCGGSGSPHHIVKRSEEPLLINCEKNIIWLCYECHLKTEQIPGFNKELKRKLQERYFKIFLQHKSYSIDEISEIAGLKRKDVEKAIEKGRLKINFVDGEVKALGIEVIRFLMGGKLL